MENKVFMLPVLRTLSRHPDTNGLVDYLLPTHHRPVLGGICPESNTLIPEGLLDYDIDHEMELFAGRRDTIPIRTYTGICGSVFQAVLTDPSHAIPEEFVIPRDPTKPPQIRNFFL